MFEIFYRIRHYLVLDFRLPPKKNSFPHFEYGSDVFHAADAPFSSFYGPYSCQNLPTLFFELKAAVIFLFAVFGSKKKIVDFLEQNSIFLLEIIRYFFKNCFMELVIRVEWMACLKLLSKIAHSFREINGQKYQNL